MFTYGITERGQTEFYLKQELTRRRLKTYREVHFRKYVVYAHEWLGPCFPYDNRLHYQLVNYAIHLSLVVTRSL